MTTSPPHSEYIDAVVKACTQQEIPPSDTWIEDDDLNGYRDDDHSGVARMLTATLEWDASQCDLAISPHVHRHGISLIWEHPAQQWMWGARKASGALAREPEPLEELPRWAEPLLLPRVVQRLIRGGRAFEPAQLWPDHLAAQAAVDAWEAAEISGQPVIQPAPDTRMIYRAHPEDAGETVFVQLSSRLPLGAVQVIGEDGRLLTVPAHHLTPSDDTAN